MNAPSNASSNVPPSTLHPSIVIAGGHSAGHIEPAMNVADAIGRLDPRATITAVGTERGLDTVLIPARGYPLELIPPVPLPRRPNADLLKTPARVAAAVRAAGAVLDRVQADVVIGFGGYVAVPTYLAARKRRTPIVIHEANARPGLGNRLGACLTTHVFTASPSVKIRHGLAIGIPLRPQIATLDRAAERGPARARLGLRPDAPTLLVTGGSQGAQRLNTAALGAAAALAAAGIQVLHIAGRNNPLTPPER
ncbi:MAG: UDP-N-acetylglucosamine--N-acetylmuramyl-(pentapeptide) pyrophosphoryl-undecaprenol, partial [Frankiales bacterium]|nr:UDP-N-acetylglucosamine--N-acetylmuramyl-(pentapeptide) pyrophosphoryl-undecaprenol [Frankiales bacterium]